MKSYKNEIERMKKNERCRQHYLNNKEWYRERDARKPLYQIKARAAANQKCQSHDGYEKHHFCYKEDNWLDVIYLTKSEHIRVHQLLKYKPSKKYYMGFDPTHPNSNDDGFVALKTFKEHLHFVIKMIGVPDFYKNKLDIL